MDIKIKKMYNTKNKKDNSKKKNTKNNQKGGLAPIIASGFTETGPLGLKVGTNGSPVTTVNNAIAFAYSVPVAVFKTIDFVIAATNLPNDIGYPYNMDNPPETTNLNLMGGKKKSTNQINSKKNNYKTNKNNKK